MKAFLTLMLAAAVVLPAADWKLFRSGTTDIVTDGKDRDAQAALNAVDQIRFLAAKWLGKTEVDPVLGVRFLLSGTGSHDLFLCRDGYLGMSINPAILHSYAKLLIEPNANRMPDWVEKGLMDVLAYVSADGPRVTVAVPSAPNEAWARVFFLASDPNYGLRLRVFLSNLQQDAPIDVASRNSLGKPWVEIEKEMAAYWAANRFEPYLLSGAPISPKRQYRARPIEQSDARKYLADAQRGKAPSFEELAAEAKPDSRNPLAFVAAAELEGSGDQAKALLDRAAELAPRWPEPFVRRATLELDLARRIPRLQKAAALDPRNASLWETLAEAQTQGRLYSEAAVSYRNAERAATTEAERNAITARRKAYENAKLDLEAAEKQRIKDEEARELEKLKNEAIARVRAAEAKANTAANANAPAVSKTIVWWEGKPADGNLEGRLEQVECMKDQTRLTFRGRDGKLIKLSADPEHLVLTGSGEMSLACGPQKPSRPAMVEYHTKADAKLGTAGAASFIEFRD